MSDPSEAVRLMKLAYELAEAEREEDVRAPSAPPGDGSPDADFGLVPVRLDPRAWARWCGRAGSIRPGPTS